MRVGDATAQRIRDYAEKHNFRLNSNARSISSGRLLNIGYFEAKKNSNAVRLLGASSGVCDAASRNGYRVVMVKLPEHTQPEDNPIPFVFRESHLDALIVSHHGFLPKACKEAIDRSGMPVVYLNEKKRNNAIYADDLSASRTLTQYLIKNGCTKIAFFESTYRGNQARHYSSIDREKGYTQAMLAAGLTPYPKVIRSNDWRTDWELWRKEHSDIDAIVCSGDMSTLLIFQSIYQNGIRIPEDLQLASFGSTFSPYCPVPVTSMEIPFYDMGVSATEMAIQMIEQATKSQLKSKVFSMELVERESTRK